MVATLPSTRRTSPTPRRATCGPQSDDPLFPLVGAFDPALPGGFPSSDHKLVWIDLGIA
jgi:hypothetical protein